MSLLARSSGRYVVRVDGHLDDHWGSVLEGWTIERTGDATTVLRAGEIDQAQLHGLLGRLRDLAAPLLAVGVECEPASVVGRTLTTKRLVLRPATPADAAATWSYRRLPQVAEWLTDLPTELTTYERQFDEPDRLATTVIAEQDGRVVGDFMVRLEDAWAQSDAPVDFRARQAELGAVLDPQETGDGLATEAVAALVEHCFTTVGVRRIVGNCFADNTASRRLMERLGMRLEERAVRESLHRSGQWLDTLTYALLRDEWSGRISR